VQRSGDAQDNYLIVFPLPNSIVLNSGVWWSLLLDNTPFVTSQYDAVFTFANQRFGEVC